ncbi:MAG: VOC family protein [Candidatus Dormibacteria bacterium]
MAFTKLTPNLAVEDVDAAVAWYTSVLDFHVEALVPDGEVHEFAILHNGAVELMLQTRRSIEEGLPTVAAMPVASTIVCFVECDDVREIWDRVESRGDVTVVSGLHDTDYGMTEFYIADPSGYVIGLASPTGAAAERSDETEAEAPLGVAGRNDEMSS